jgi:hypothetical protein
LEVTSKNKMHKSTKNKDGFSGKLVEGYFSTPQKQVKLLSDSFFKLR